MDIFTKLATINTTELLFMVEMASKKNGIADYESRIINLEIYRRESLKLAPITPRWLKDSLHISTPKIIKLLGRLEGYGFIKKTPSSIDRRSVEITHTVLGRIRIESYLSTILLGMESINMLVLSEKDKKLVQSAINDNLEIPILKGMSNSKKKLLLELWSHNHKNA